MLLWLKVSWMWNTIHSCWSKQCHDHRNPRKQLPKIRSGFLESTPVLSRASVSSTISKKKLTLLSLEVTKVCELSNTFQVTVALFISLVFLWNHLFYPVLRQPSVLNKALLDPAVELHPSWGAGTALPSPKENEPQLSLLSSVSEPFPNCAMPPQIFICSSSSNFQISFILEF